MDCASAAMSKGKTSSSNTDTPKVSKSAWRKLAAELVREKVDVIVTTASVSALAARKATQTIPIVMTSGNPLELGLAKSLAHPGGNVTGSDRNVVGLERQAARDP